MNLFARRPKPKREAISHLKSGNAGAASTEKSTDTAKKNVPQAEPPAARRTSLNTADPATSRPLRTWVIKHMPAFIQRREAKKLAPKAAEFQVSKMLKALKDGDTNEATTAALKLKAALAPLDSSKPNAQNRDELMAVYMGKQLPSAWEDLENLRHKLEPLTSDSVLGLLSFVVQTLMDRLSTLSRLVPLQGRAQQEKLEQQKLNVAIRMMDIQ